MYTCNSFKIVKSEWVRPGFLTFDLQNRCGQKVRLKFPSQHKSFKELFTDFMLGAGVNEITDTKQLHGRSVRLEGISGDRQIIQTPERIRECLPGVALSTKPHHYGARCYG